MARDIFERTVPALREAEAHAKGETPLGMVVHVAEAVDLAEIRRRTGKAQPAFAASIGLPVSTLRQSGSTSAGSRRAPPRVLLALPEKNPRLVEETLGAPA